MCKVTAANAAAQAGLGRFIKEAKTQRRQWGTPSPADPGRDPHSLSWTMVQGQARVATQSKLRRGDTAT